NNVLNNIIFGDMIAKGDVLNMHCVQPCSDTYDDESCYNDCIKENLGAGFCYPKLPSTDKDCCCS
ncbi:hypothetical protein Csa_006400, partial [Cucumis sativus]